MSDAEDKTGRHRNWASAIPLATLLGVVFTAGIVYAKLQINTTGLDSLGAKFDKYAEASEKRMRSLEDDRTAREAVSTPIVQKFLEDHAPRAAAAARKARPVSAAKEPGP